MIVKLQIVLVSWCGVWSETSGCLLGLKGCVLPFEGV